MDGNKIADIANRTLKQSFADALDRRREVLEPEAYAKQQADMAAAKVRLCRILSTVLPR